MHVSHFHPLEGVVHGSETQRQVGENVSYITYRYTS